MFAKFLFWVYKQKMNNKFCKKKKNINIKIHTPNFIFKPTTIEHLVLAWVVNLITKYTVNNHGIKKNNIMVQINIHLFAIIFRQNFDL